MSKIVAASASAAASTVPACLGHAILAFSTPLTAVYRARPIAPGHVVVCPRKNGVRRLSELSEAVYLDLFATAHKLVARNPVNSMDKSSDCADELCFNLNIKNGSGAGAPFPHLHLHVIPRRPIDFKPDAIYGLVDAWHPEEGKTNHPPKLEFPHDSERKPRTSETMAEEAMRYRKLVMAAAPTMAPPSSPLTSSPAKIVNKFSPQKFGRIPISVNHIFLGSDLTYAFVNLKPLVPGHVLISPKRVTPRLYGLTAAEQQDLWRTVMTVQKIVGQAYSTRDFIVAVQDGALAGQSVPHVHVHILPIPQQTKKRKRESE